MKYLFREHHLFSLLEGYDKQTLPLDLFISHYFRDHKALGSKDRGFIADSAYAMIRWKELLDYLCGKEGSWEERFRTLQGLDLKKIMEREDIPLHTRCSFPKILFDLLTMSYGEKTAELCLICNQPAPTTIRVNTLKTTRDELLKLWQSKYEVSPCRFSKEGILFHKKISFFGLPEFKEGLFEVQDEASQLLAGLVQANPGDHVLDYCAGSGGKTLAFAPRLQNQGQIYVHDIRKFILTECRKRLKRAGIQNAQPLQPDDEQKLKKLKKKMDWILVDAPCTGTGTMRRNPDMKWKFTEETLPRLVGQQRTIFEKALSFMKPEGKIVYATCSILKQENQEQVDHFIKTYDLIIDGEVMQTLPTPGGMDGFFGVVLKKALR